jgi:branched-chain amino acid transport system ATP-binding protein
MSALLEINEVSHSFGGLCALSNVNFELERGELAAVIGPNGAGKTTLFNLISGIYRAASGSIRFEGAELVGLPPHAVSALGIARTFQNIRLFKELSVLDNVLIGCSAKMGYRIDETLLHLGRYRAAETKARGEAHHLLDALQLSAYGGEPAGSLPYGLQRRLEIARALATGPRLLLLDEPAAGMNPHEVEELMALIGRLQREFALTILLIEHQMRLVMGICRRICVLDFGARIACGGPAEIQSNARVLEAYLGQEVS